MPIQYLKNSFKRMENKAVEFKIKNTEGSARVNVSPSIFLDERDFTQVASISVKGGNFTKINQDMDLDILYGEVITIRLKPDEPILSGNHSVKVQIKVNWPLWTTFVSEFNAKL